MPLIGQSEGYAERREQLAALLLDRRGEGRGLHDHEVSAERQRALADTSTAASREGSEVIDDIGDGPTAATSAELASGLRRPVSTACAGEVDAVTSKPLGSR